MTTFSLKNKPDGLTTMRKKTTINAAFIKQPFVVHTQEGVMEIGPETVDDWDGGYWVVYPDDGSKPYAIAPRFMADNYEQVA